MKTLRIVGLAVAVGGAALLAVTQFRTRPVDVLVEAAAESRYRVSEARLTGGFPYRPVAPVMRGTERARTMIIAAGEATHGRDDLHARATSELLQRNWDAAADAFDEALRAETGHDDRAVAIAASSNAELLSDLAAAHLARGRHTNQPRAFLVALEAAERAWRLRRTPEIAWNRALARESWHLRESARAAWADYLALDPDSPWAGEVRERVAKLAAPTAKEQWNEEKERLTAAAARGDARETARIVRAFPMQSRMAVERELLPAWAAAYPRAEARRSLDAARAVSSALYRFNGDAMFHDTIDRIDSADPARREATARAIAIYAEAVALRVAWRIDESRPAFLEAERALLRAHSPLAQMARMYRMHVTRLTDHNAPLAAIDAWAASPEFDEQRHPSLWAQVWWARGLCALSAGKPQAALHDYSRALALFVALGETDNVTGLHLTIAEQSDYVGDWDGAWTHRMAGLQQLAASGTMYGHLLELMTYSGIAAMRERMPAAAVVLFDNGPVATTNPAFFDSRFFALLGRSAAHRAAGDQNAATADLRAAREVASKIPDATARKHALMAPEVVRDRLAQTRDAGARRRILDEAIAVARERDFAYRLSQLHLDRGLEHLRAGRSDEARAALFEAVDELERQRGGISEEERRGSFLHTRQPVYGPLIDLLCRRGEYGRAFEVVERSRARTLLDDVRGEAVLARAASLPEIRKALDGGTLLVEYARVGDALAVWLVSRDEVRFVATSRRVDEITRLANRFRTAVREEEESVRAASAALHAAIVAPWYRHAAAYERLVIVPSQALAGLPFAALLDGKTGEFLVERHVLTSAPSASVHAACVMRDRARSREDGPVLVMAPASVAATSGGQILLAESGQEARTVAASYPEATVLTAERATSRAFLDRAPHARIIHFGGHTGSSASPIPHLLFASTARTPDVLHAEDIRALRLENTRMVALAACSSATEPVNGNDQGSSSLARAFLAAGAATVVASYWDVDDDAAARLSRALHAFTAAGDDPAAALRGAQLQMLTAPQARGKRMGSWAAFAAIGGSSAEQRRQQ